jgi:tetratricopeptide (TPR) repeat protein
MSRTATRIDEVSARGRARLVAASLLAGVLVLTGVVACDAGDGPPADPDLQGTSLLGEPLIAFPDTGQTLADARAGAAEAPESMDAHLELGRALAALFRYREAQDVYSLAHDVDPEDWRPLRFRGHRHISLRQFDRAVADLEEARERAPYSFDVAYHLGLALYLSGDFEAAAAEYGSCLELAADAEALALEASGALGEGFRSCMSMRDSDDTRVALLDWYWRALNRAGREEEAAGLLTGVSRDMDVTANTAYHHLLLHYRGEIGEDELLAGAGDIYRLETVGYGLANRRLLDGDTAGALALLAEVAEDSQWPGFGRIAAEADLVRLDQRGGG